MRKQKFICKTVVFLLILNPKNTFLILDVFECPGDSPGFNPIQDVWNIMKVSYER